MKQGFSVWGEDTMRVTTVPRGTSTIMEYLLGARLYVSLRKDGLMELSTPLLSKQGPGSLSTCPSLRQLWAAMTTAGGMTEHLLGPRPYMEYFTGIFSWFCHTPIGEVLL